MLGQLTEFENNNVFKKDEEKYMIDVYMNCPTFENEFYMLRKVEKEDAKDLLKVYSDSKAVPFFNSDNCGGE